MKPSFLDHIVLIVKDINETQRFYSSFLGDPDYLDSEQVVYKIGETKMFFALPYKEWETLDKDKGGLNHVAFGARTSEELKEFEETLNKASIKIAE